MQAELARYGGRGSAARFPGRTGTASLVNASCPDPNMYCWARPDRGMRGRSLSRSGWVGNSLAAGKGSSKKAAAHQGAKKLCDLLNGEEMPDSEIDTSVGI